MVFTFPAGGRSVRDKTIDTTKYIKDQLSPHYDWSISQQLKLDQSFSVEMEFLSNEQISIRVLFGNAKFENIIHGSRKDFATGVKMEVFAIWRGQPGGDDPSRRRLQSSNWAFTFPLIVENTYSRVYFTWILKHISLCFICEFQNGFKIF